MVFGFNTVTDTRNPNWEYKVIGRDEEGNLKINHRAKNPKPGMLGPGGTVQTMSKEDWKAFKKQLKLADVKLKGAQIDEFRVVNPIKVLNPSLSTNIDENNYPLLSAFAKVMDKTKNDMMFIATTGVHPAIAPQFLKDAHPFYNEVKLS